MNRNLRIYADVDSFFDIRRGLIQYLITEGIVDPVERKAEGDRLWDLHIAKNYKERAFDTFSYPQLGIDQEKFKAIYNQRSVDHWATGMVYPTRLAKQLVARIIDIEGLTERPIDIKEVNLYVNTWPYEFGEELTAELVEAIRHSLKGIVNVKAIHSNPFDQDAGYYAQYQHVFRYNLILDESSLSLMESFEKHPIPETSFVIPDIQVRANDTYTSHSKDWMQANCLWLAPALRLLPIEHSLYDYDE